MALIETLTFELGSSIAKSILKVWLKDSSMASDASVTVIDVLKAWTTDRTAQRRAQRQLEEIGERIGESLLPIFETDGAKLDEGDRTAVALAVAETLDLTSSAILVQYNLIPTELTNYLLEHSIGTEHFNDTEKSLYQRIISESCEYIVNIASQLPAFTEYTFAEVLKREGQLLSIADQILQEIRQMRKQLDPLAETAHFELAYRRAVIRNLDVLQLFGIDIATSSRRHRLSLAYVTLSVEQRSKFPHERKNSAEDTIIFKSLKDLQNEGITNIVSVNEALVGTNRVLISGQAGSGKTTLLQWIAVNSAAHSFTGLLSDWNGTLPFYIRLRHCIQSGLPAPETFPRLITVAIADIIPKGWVHTELASGRAIVLIDGLDEVPASKREDVRIWLKDLMEAYPKTRFIVTSRPHAVQEDLIEHKDFKVVELQPMGLSDIYTFIDHWHAAVADELRDKAEKIELLSCAEHIKEEIERNRSKRNLATTPLLCAMLCTLNRERRQQLPSDRIELYEACCQLLIERRDKERGVPLADYPILNYRQKRVLLEDLAYWLIKNDWSEVERQLADSRFTKKLVSMPDIPRGISGADILKLFVERTGIIREPMVGRIDFTHRTFQEFLAAQAVVDEIDIGMLMKNAHNDQWREVIILACGLAPRRIRHELIKNLIARGDKEPENRYRLHLLAISCLETSIELEQDVKIELENRLRYIVPPKDMTTANALALVGDLAVKYLSRNRQYDSLTTAACIRTLSLIGSEAALKALETYINDTRSPVIDELWRAWDFFEKEAYVQHILSKIYQGEDITLSRDISSLRGFQFFTYLEFLNLSSCGNVTDLSPLATLSHLKTLNLASCGSIRDLSPLATLEQLVSLSLSYAKQVNDLSPLASLYHLTSLTISGSKRVSDLSPLTNLKQLRALNLAGCGNVRDLSPLADLEELTSLNLAGFKQVSDLSPLTNLKQLRALNLAGCGNVRDLSPLSSLEKLESLNLSYCRQIKSLDFLVNLNKLSSLDLSECGYINDLSPLANLKQLTSLNLLWCLYINDLSPLASLEHLTSLNLSGCRQVRDLSPLRNLKHLKSLKSIG